MVPIFDIKILKTKNLRNNSRRIACMEIYEITIINLNTQEEQILPIEVDEAEETEYIVVRTVFFGQEISASDYNYLPAYQAFRDMLLRLGYGMKCNASRINVVQSGMMGAADKVYLVELGRQALMKDIVHIWDYAYINEFPDTEQQKAFFEKWTDSLMR